MKTKLLIGLAVAGGAFAGRRRLAAFAQAKVAKCIAMCSGGGCHAAPAESGSQAAA